ncbi:FtsW/RodA/SpoVE family cell cycle protein, partial [Peribacillus sp. NPDC056705]|uniref:FtsW/RodA/SpoVE family cell cycle protein n=1 Tax=Peribacillus sp. NPDC056705 TaxID=3345918 RepID=UPI0037481A8F
MLEKIKKIDYVIVFVLAMLMIISIVSIYSATANTRFEGLHLRMIGYYIVGFIAFFGISLIDYRVLIKYATYIYLGGLLILVLVIFIGTDLNGAQGWIYIGGLSIQPAELFKLVLIIFLAYVLVRKNKAQLGFWKDVIPLGLLTLLPFGIVMIQNDLGNA